MHVQPIAHRVAQNLEIISQTISTNQDSAHGIYDDPVINEKSYENLGTPGNKLRVFRNHLPPDVLTDGPRASQYTPPQPTSRRERLGTATLQPPPASSHTHFSEFQWANFENSSVPHTKNSLSVWDTTHSLSVWETQRADTTFYGVATIRRLLEITCLFCSIVCFIGLFCKRDL